MVGALRCRERGTMVDSWYDDKTAVEGSLQELVWAYMIAGAWGVMVW